MVDKPGVIITGADFQALAVLRTFAKKKIPVILLDSNNKFLSIANYSRYEKNYIKCPELSKENEYIKYLLDLAKSNKIQDWLIMPNSDEAVFILSKYKNELSKHFKIPVPDLSVIENVYIKKNTYRIGEEIGVPVPKTWNPSNLSELQEIDHEFPLVIKPSIRDNYYNKVKTKAYKANNKEELIKIYKQVCKVIKPSEVLVQEMIEGGPKNLYSYGTFYKSSMGIGLVGRRSRQHPMDFGHATTFAEIVENDELPKLAHKFLAHIGYYGIAEVEFMYDEKNKVYKLIEVNPRVWGWHSLLLAAGLDLPYYLYLDTYNDTIKESKVIKNLKWVRLITDLPTIFKEILSGRMKLSAYLISMRGKKEFAVWSWKDPLPFFAEIVLIPYLWIKRGF